MFQRQVISPVAKGDEHWDQGANGSHKEVSLCLPRLPFLILAASGHIYPMVFWERLHAVHLLSKGSVRHLPHANMCGTKIPGISYSFRIQNLSDFRKSVLYTAYYITSLEESEAGS